MNMTAYKNEEQHKENLKALGRMGGMVLSYFCAIWLAAYFNIQVYPTRMPWFIVVIIIGGIFIVPRARAVMRAFEDNSNV